MENTHWFLMILVILTGLLVFSNTPALSSPAQQDAAPTTQNTTTDQQTVPPRQEQNRREFKAMLWASIVILVGLFSLVFILFIFRMARAVRRLQHAREEKTHTEVIDAWSQHRLPDETSQDFSD